MTGDCFAAPPAVAAQKSRRHRGFRRRRLFGRAS